jgi:hypothetical protein
VNDLGSDFSIGVHLGVTCAIRAIVGVAPVVFPDGAPRYGAMLVSPATSGNPLEEKENAQLAADIKTLAACGNYAFYFDEGSEVSQGSYRCTVRIKGYLKYWETPLGSCHSFSELLHAAADYVQMQAGGSNATP